MPGCFDFAADFFRVQWAFVPFGPCREEKPQSVWLEVFHVLDYRMPFDNWDGIASTEVRGRVLRGERKFAWP